MRNKTSVNCPNCTYKVSIPKGMFVLFTCPKCSNEFEIDGRIKRVSNYKYFKWLFLFLMVISFSGGIYYFQNSKIQDEKNTNQPNTNNTIEKRNNSIKDNFYQRRLNALIGAVDISNETTNDYAVRLASTFPGVYNISQVCHIFDYIVKNWKYVNDSDKMENFRSATRSINNNLSGDCDDFAILISALIESIGGHTRISIGYNKQGGHAFTEVLVADKKEDMKSVINDINSMYRTDQFKINYTIDKTGKCWLNLDWFGKPQHPGGKYFDYQKRTIYYPTIKNPTYELE